MFSWELVYFCRAVSETAGSRDLTSSAVPLLESVPYLVLVEVCCEYCPTVVAAGNNRIVSTVLWSLIVVQMKCKGEVAAHSCHHDAHVWLFGCCRALPLKQVGSIQKAWLAANTYTR